VKQPWYSDDAGAGGSFEDLRRFFTRLQEIGPSYGYFPEPSKSILIVQEFNRTSAKSAFADLGFNVQTGHQYLGGIIGSSDDQSMWIESKVADWTNAIADLAFVALSHPQSAYAGLQKSLQMEWQFVQQVVEGIGDDFSEIEKSIDDLFLLALFSDKLEDRDARRFLRKLPVKFAGLGLPDPVASSDSNLEASTLVCSHLLAAF
jgi:hypothetical protein